MPPRSAANRPQSSAAEDGLMGDVRFIQKDGQSVDGATVRRRFFEAAIASRVHRFLNAVERAVPAGKLIHAIVDNYATHKHPKVQAWLIRHPRWTFHFTPTSSSWLNAVETFFSALTRKRLRRGLFRSIVDLRPALNRYLNEHNRDPKPSVCTSPA